jgi:hypothetical protein
MYFNKNEVNNILTCKYCEGRLEESKLLPCGKSICSLCVPTIKLNQSSEYDCSACNQKHEMSKNGLPVNEVVVEMLSLQAIPVVKSQDYESLQEILIDIQKKRNLLNICLNNSQDCIIEHCNELRDQVQLAKESIIMKINDLSDVMIDEIDEYKHESMDLNRKNLKRLKRYENVDKELESFHLKTEEYLKQNNLNDNKIAKLNQDALKLKEKADFTLKNVREKIFSERFLMFEANKETLTKSILGKMELTNMNSTILRDENQIKDLMNLCEFPIYQKWNLIYRASQDGFEARDFHSKCDNKSDTLIVIKSTNVNIFGGYTERNWKGSNHESVDKDDPNAFFFSLVNKDNKPLKMNLCDEEDGGIRCNNSNGPIFGGNHGDSDLVIGDKSNKNTDNCSSLDHYYEHPDYEFQSNEAEKFLAGSKNFQVSEIEVYTK